MSNLSTVQIPAQTFEGTGLEKHTIIIQVMGDDIDNTLMIGDVKSIDAEGEDELYYVKKGSSDNIYLITKEQRDELERKIWQFK